MYAHPCFINCMTKEKWGILQKQIPRRINVMPRISEPPEWREPEDVVVKALQYMRRGGKALDVGAGRGNNTICLAHNGFKVHATDKDPKQLKRLQERATKANRFLNQKISTEVRDVKQGIEGEFDTIMCNRVLHQMPRELALAFVADMKQHTSKGGLNIISAVMQSGDFWNAAQDRNRLNKMIFKDGFYAGENELHILYDDWEILDYREEWKMYPMGNPEDSLSAQKNKTALLIARKPLVSHLN